MHCGINLNMCVVKLPSKPIEDIAYQWSVTSDRYTDTDFNNLIGDYKDGIQGKDGSISIGTIYHHAYSMEAVA